MTVGLWNATLLLSEKSYYFMAFTLSLFAVITIQKNIRDLQAVKEYENPYEQGDVFLEKDDFLKEKE
ncbi:Inner membrane protein yiaA [Moraxella caprae]|uniref:Inner membrane protein yiaA n=1 Tax=Moraxella caprae TaxID=90240 RepID=A0A378R464_9GAMM|nr:YiaA/YiaB family inner membrane protein [Moraxella caprae]STZ09467.1 Inner membrane protein yiaA [Moraxella caprae]